MSGANAAGSGLHVDASSVYRLLLDEQQTALAAARAGLERMRAHVTLRDPDALLALASLFGLVKAGAGYLGFSLLREVAYEAERVVDQLRQPSARQAPRTLDLLEQALQQIARGLEYARSQRRTADFEEQAGALCAALRTVELTPSLLPEQLSDQELFALDARRHVQLCREALVRAADDAAHASDAIHAAFRAMHTFKGNAGMMGFSELEALGRAAEHTLEGLRAGQLTLTGALTIALLDLLEKAQVAIDRPQAFRWQREALALDTAAAESRVLARRTRLGALLVENNLVSQEQVELVLAIKREPLGQALVLLHALEERELEKALTLQRKLRAGEEPEERLDGAPQGGSAHIAQRKIERVQRRLWRVRLALGACSPELSEALQQLEESVATLTRVPLRASLRRAALMMRDLAERQHKRLTVHVSGEELEVDRSVAASLADALVHLGRNAVDHGLEHPIARVAAGKDELCRITLRAHLTPDGLHVELSDDGRGLSRELIVHRACELELLDIADAHKLSQEQVLDLVFQPGFSTAQRVTDVSGRGVGLDAVKHAIEAHGGRVTIESEAGRGARVRLTIPQRHGRASVPSAAPVSPLEP